jgi:hypothetical protein
MYHSSSKSYKPLHGGYSDQNRGCLLLHQKSRRDSEIARVITYTAVPSAEAAGSEPTKSSQTPFLVFPTDSTTIHLPPLYLPALATQTTDLPPISVLDLPPWLYDRGLDDAERIPLVQYEQRGIRIPIGSIICRSRIQGRWWSRI